MWYDGETSLPALLELVIQNYEIDRKSFWSDDAQEARLLELMERIAETLTTASDELQGSSLKLGDVDIDWHQLRFLASLPAFQAHLLDQLEIGAAYKLAAQTPEVARRCWELTSEVLFQRPGDRALKYIRRLSRCYVAGFLPECVILSRALVESALIERFEKANVPLPANSDGPAPMRTRVEAARRFRWLSDKGAANAMMVWQRGSTAVHHDPEVTRDVLGTVRAAVQVLQELYA